MIQLMLVFIDESGDPGFSLERGASPIFVAAMVIFETDDAAGKTQSAVVASEARRLHKPKEFKFNKCSDDIRDGFFQAVAPCSFRVRAIVVRKELIHSPRLIADKERFYEYFVKQMMKFDNGVLADAKVVIDGSGDREFRRDLNAALRLRLRQGMIKSVRFKNSANDVLLQLADMCVGAIARSYRADRDKSNRWRTMLGRHIDDVWEFK
jgi:hypothetical protein